MSKEDLRDITIGSPILVKAYLADADSSRALIRIEDAKGQAKECWVKQSSVIIPKYES